MNIKQMTVALVLAVLLIGVLVAACNTAPPVVVDPQGLSETKFQSIRVNGTSHLIGDVTLDNDLSVAGDITAASIVTDGNATLTSVSTTGNITDAGALTVGGGFGATGCTLSAAGVLQCDGAMTIGGAATITGASALNGGAAITGSFTVSGFTQYPFVFFGNDSSVNGTMIAHGMGNTLTYPWCMVYDAAWVTATARISATNATSATIAIFGTDGEPWTSPPVPVRCGAVYVP